MMLLLLQGLRWALVLAAVGTCAGSWVKVFSVGEDRFWVTFLGQTVVAVSQVFILNVPARLAAVWFGPGQVSSACSIGVFGNQVRNNHVHQIKCLKSNSRAAVKLWSADCPPRRPALKVFLSSCGHV